MKENGLNPGVVNYTTVIDAYRRVRNFDKCWEIYDTVSVTE